MQQSGELLVEVDDEELAQLNELHAHAFVEDLDEVVARTSAAELVLELLLQVQERKVDRLHARYVGERLFARKIAHAAAAERPQRVVAEHAQSGEATTGADASVCFALRLGTTLVQVELDLFRVVED